MSLGRKINYARITKGLTQEEVAKRAEISIKSVQRAEKNVGVSLEVIQKISEVLGIEYKDVFDATKHLDKISEDLNSKLTLIKRSILFNNNYMIKKIIKVIDLKRDEILLDLACGPGIMTRKLAKKTKYIWGLDASESMVRTAKNNCNDVGVNHAQFVEGNEEHLCFENDKFDVVVTRFLFHHLNNPDKVLAEMGRVLKKDGRLVICDISTSDDLKESKLHNAIEAIRDPSHVEMLSNKNYLKLFTNNNYKVTKVDAFEVVRGYDEWLEIQNAPHRYEPLLEIIRNLIEVGKTAGVNLRYENDKIYFNQTIVIYELKKAW